MRSDPDRCGRRPSARRPSSIPTISRTMLPMSRWDGSANPTKLRKAPSGYARRPPPMLRVTRWQSMAAIYCSDEKERPVVGQLEGKVALVTGWGRGLGRACARTFAREVAKVLIVDLNRNDGDETVRLIEEAGGEAAFVEAEVG